MYALAKIRNGQEKYFSGEYQNDGHPKLVTKSEDALLFDSASKAYLFGDGKKLLRYFRAVFVEYRLHEDGFKPRWWM